MSAVERVRAAFEALRRVDRPEVWISLRAEGEVLEEAEAIDRRVAAGARLPLAGLVVGVKDNIDVAGLPTTAGAASYAYQPERDAEAVARVRAAGAVVLGKTNLDQFATGLVGTRSPFGAVRNAWDVERISGGSSSGSAVAVALGVVDLALGTDTAGSGRVPAALNGVVGVKPTRGLVPTSGVVPACRSLDCVTVFAGDLALARLAAGVLSGDDERDRAVLPAAPRVAVPTLEHLAGLDDGWAEAFGEVVSRLRRAGVEIVEVDIAPLLEAAGLLYGGAFVAERYAAVGVFIEKNRALIGSDLDPTVASIVLGGASWSAADVFRDRERLEALGAAGLAALADCDALLTPTTTGHPTLAEVAAEPVAVNTRLGRFTNFANLLDLAALAVPAGFVGGLPFGVMFTGRAFSDRALVALAERLAAPRVELAVFGAHLRGQPLNGQLVGVGGTFVGDVRTSAEYRLYRLATEPVKPGLVRVAAGAGAGAGGSGVGVGAAEGGVSGGGSVGGGLPDGGSLGGASSSDGLPGGRSAGGDSPADGSAGGGLPGGGSSGGASSSDGLPGGRSAGEGSPGGGSSSDGLLGGGSLRDGLLGGGLAGGDSPDGGSAGGGLLGRASSSDDLLGGGSSDGDLPDGGSSGGGSPGEGGAAIRGELWSLPAAGFAVFVASLPPPMTIGSVGLDDGRAVPGFLCEPVAVAGAVDITVWQGWRAYLAAAADGGSVEAGPEAWREAAHEAGHNGPCE